MSPINTLTEHLGHHDAATVMAALKAGGWIIVRHDAIKLAQAHAREDLLPGNKG